MFSLLKSFSFCISAELVIRTDNDGKACVHDLLIRGERKTLTLEILLLHNLTLYPQMISNFELLYQGRQHFSAGK